MSGATKNSPAGVANGGYWGIALKTANDLSRFLFCKGEGILMALSPSVLFHTVGENEQTNQAHGLEWNLRG